MMPEFLKHQIEVLTLTKNFNRCAHYLKMGLGKTFTGAEKMVSLGEDYNLLICQKSKVDDWINHFKEFYPNIPIIDYTVKGSVMQPGVSVVNYELAWRRPELKKLNGFTLMLDESSNIMHENTKQASFICKLHFKNLILLSGTPCGGRYELLLSQLNLLGWNISKKLFISQYCLTESKKLPNGRWVKSIIGYKNIDRLKRKSKEYGCVWMETEEAVSLPPVIDQTIKPPVTSEYKQFIRDNLITVSADGCKVKNDYNSKEIWFELVGDTPLKKLLYARQLCGQFNKNKVKAFEDILMSTDDRLIVFYNFVGELELLKKICEKHHRPVSEINGGMKDTVAYFNISNSVTLIQYQAGAMGLNLQLANRIVYFSLPLQWELYEQSKARIRRIGQEKTCFYYYLICKGSIEEKIHETLKQRKDYDARLFENDFS